MKKKVKKPMMRKGGVRKSLPKAQTGTPWQQYLKTYPTAAATDTLPQGYSNSTNPAGMMDFAGRGAAAERANKLTYGREDTSDIMDAAQEREARAKAGNYSAGVPGKRSGGAMYKKGGMTKKRYQDGGPKKETNKIPSKPIDTRYMKPMSNKPQPKTKVGRFLGEVASAVKGMRRTPAETAAKADLIRAKGERAKARKEGRATKIAARKGNYQITESRKKGGSTKKK